MSRLNPHVARRDLDFYRDVPTRLAPDCLTGIPVVETPNLPADTMVYSSGGPIGDYPGIYALPGTRRTLFLGARPVPRLASVRLACLLDLDAIVQDAYKRLGLNRSAAETYRLSGETQ